MIIRGINPVIGSFVGHIFDFKTSVFAKGFLTQLKSIHNNSILKKIDWGFGISTESFLFETLLKKDFTVRYH